ncbi:MAG: DUF1616 domain-containing protein [Armatimonadota bacterium]|nr:DUF1616 domain-containing protein [Armatimonadota bacterium]MDR7475797.1 DUF1616 domain-containing protein [Armatimonadota bacterium]
MRFLDDLLAILAATAALLGVIVLFPGSPVRVVLGLPFVLFFPGYALIAALYPRRDDLDGIERLALSLGLSLAVVPLIGLVLNYTPWGIRLTPILVGLTLFTVTCCAVAARNRSRLPAAERFPADIRPVLAALRSVPWLTVGLSAMVITVLLALGFRTGLLGRSRVGETFTEFYVLGPGGKAQGYPRRVFAGDLAEVILGIANREGRLASYTVEIRAGEDLLNRLGPIALKHDQQWEERVRFAPRRPGDRVKVEFLLYIDGIPEPYRRLHLWLQVRPP